MVTPTRTIPMEESIAFTLPHEKANDTEAMENNNPEDASTTVLRIPERATGISWILVVIAILSSTFLFALDNTVVADIQPKLILTLGEVEKLPWVAVAYGLGSMSVNLLWGKLYGQFDIKTLFIAAVAIFEIGSVISGAAPTLNLLIIGRAICGVGAPGLYIGAINLLTVFTTMAERPLYMSLVGATWCLGTVLGPILGGAFAESKASWRWAFYINLVVAAISAPAYIFLIPSYCAVSEKSITNRLSTIDFLGAILFLGASVCLAMGISFGGALYLWSSGQIIALLAIAGLLWIAFVLQQYWCICTSKTHRLFPVQFMESYEMCILFALVASGISCVFLPVYFIPLYCQFVLGDSPLQAGVRLMPFVSILVFGALFNGGLLPKLPLYMPWFTIGGLIALVGSVLLSTLTINSTIPRLYGYSIISSFGAGLFVNLPFTVAQCKVPEEHVPAANSFISCGQISGITLCLAVGNSIFLNIATAKLTPLFPEANRAEIQGEITGIGSNLFSKLPTSLRNEVLSVIVSSISKVYIMSIASAALVFLLSFLLKRDKLKL